MDARQLLQGQHSVCVCVCVFFKQHNTINCLWREKQNFLKKSTDAAATTRAEYCQRLKIWRSKTDTERERERERERAALKELGKSPAIERASWWARHTELLTATERVSDDPDLSLTDSFTVWLDSLSLAETLKESLKNECTRYLPISHLVVT
jgi:hypothetical protein